MENIHALIRKAPFVFALLIVCTAAIFFFALDAWFLPTQGTLLILQLAVVITALLGNKQSAIFAVEDSLVHLDVVDEGPGIGWEQKEAVFALFFSTRTGDSGYGGSGIGLTVAKGIIEAHHGRISILPSNKGCTVRISLPSVGSE